MVATLIPTTVPQESQKANRSPLKRSKSTTTTKRMGLALRLTRKMADQKTKTSPVRFFIISCYVFFFLLNFLQLSNPSIFVNRRYQKSLLSSSSLLWSMIQTNVMSSVSRSPLLSLLRLNFVSSTSFADRRAGLDPPRKPQAKRKLISPFVFVAD